MEKTSQKHILEKDTHLSIAYTIAFGKPTSKYEIQKYLTDSSRYTTITDRYSEYFKFTKRSDKKRGKLVQSKPDLLLELLYAKVKLEPKSKINLKKLLKNKLIEKTIHQTVYDYLNSRYKPIINHNLLLKDIVILFIGKYMTEKYRNFFKPTKSQEERLQKANYLKENFMPDLYDKRIQKKHDKHSLEMKELLDKFDYDTMEKIIYIYPDHRLFLKLTRGGIIMAESSK